MSADRPSAGLTLLAPWSAFILRGPKRLENRSQGVATVARRHIGETIALTASQQYKRKPVALMLEAIHARVDSIVESHHPFAWQRSVAGYDFMLWAGRWVGTATLEKVIPPHEARKRPWSAHYGQSIAEVEASAKPQWGLILTCVHEIEPAIPATGGQGLWQVRWCACGRMMSSTTPPPCKECKPAVPEPIANEWLQGSLL